MAVPTYVQGVLGPTVSNLGADNYKIRLPNPTLANNLIIVIVTTGSSNTVSIADDAPGGTNTYTSGVSGSGNQFVQIFFCAGCKAGATVITVSFSATQNFVQCGMMEFYNVATSAPTDGTAHFLAGTSTTMSTAAITTAADGDLVIQVAWQDSGAVTTTSLTAGSSPWKLLFADIQCNGIGACAVQYQIQGTHGSITPSMTQAPSAHFDSAAIAFKSASAGTAPSATGIRAQTVYHATVGGSIATPVKLQFPCTGNLLIAATLMIDALAITGITDGNSNSWSFAGAGFSSGSGSGKLRIAYAVNPTTTSAMTGPTFVFTGSNASGDTIVMLDVVGADTVAPFDSTAGNPTATGTDSTAAAHNITTVSITPSKANGLIVSMFGLTNPGPCDAVSPGVFLSTVVSPEANSGDANENNGWALEYNSDTASRTYLFHFPATAGGAGSWAAMAAAFQAAPVAGDTVTETLNFKYSG